MKSLLSFLAKDHILPSSSFKYVPTTSVLLCVHHLLIFVLIRLPNNSDLSTIQLYLNHFKSLLLPNSNFVDTLEPTQGLTVNSGSKPLSAVFAFCSHFLLLFPPLFLQIPGMFHYRYLSNFLDHISPIFLFPLSNFCLQIDCADVPSPSGNGGGGVLVQ
jgi:hypothetical protein